jgi:FkbM family methyltransferase
VKTFIEIGTSDFDTNLEFIETGGWKGIMVEPSPPFNKIMQEKINNCKFYKNIILEGCAISDFDGHVEFAVAKDIEGWQRGISTVISDNHQGHCLYSHPENKTNNYERIIKVRCITLDSLIEKYNVTSVDYLKVDTEGHELNIFNNYSWSVKPTFIKSEIKHIDEQKLRDILNTQGYRVYLEKEDLYAIYQS